MAGSVSGYFTYTGGTSHGGECTPHTPNCVCTDPHKCTPVARINGVNLFKQGWLPKSPGECRPDLTVYGFNYFSSSCCPPGTYGGPPRAGPFTITCVNGMSIQSGSGAYGTPASGTPTRTPKAPKHTTTPARSVMTTVPSTPDITTPVQQQQPAAMPTMIPSVVILGGILVVGFVVMGMFGK